MMLLLLLSSAKAEPLTEPVLVRQPLVVEGRQIDGPLPLYLLPDTTFTRMLADSRELVACREGLIRIEQEVEQAERELEASRERLAGALGQASSALEAASIVMAADAEADEVQVQTIFELEAKLGRARSQRNVALGISAGIVGALVVVAVTP
jgi:hypothetical protein